jgi:membrane protein
MNIRAYLHNRHIKWLIHQGEWLFYFTRYFSRQFLRQQGMQVAAFLAYTTLLSLVPLFAVTLTVLSGLPMFDRFNDAIQTFIFSNFVPNFGETIRDYLSTFSTKASQLTVTGLGVLFIIALMLMNTIDGTLNTIWHVHHRRNPVSRFLIYWAVITLGPLLLGIGLLSTSYLLSLPLLSDVGGGYGLKTHLLSWLPFLTSTVAFTLLYILIPNCFVMARHALIGGVTAAVLFELAKYGFGLYVSKVPSHEIYGAVAIIPIFLIWIYLSWIIVLLGAHITFCLSAFRIGQEKAGRREGDWDFIEVFRIIALLWQVQKEGRSLGFNAISRYGIRIPQYHFNEIMEHLQDARWVESNNQGAWLLSRDLDDVTVLDLHRIIPRPLPHSVPERSVDRELDGLYAVIRDYRARLDKSLAVPLSAVLRDGAGVRTAAAEADERIKGLPA